MNKSALTKLKRPTYRPAWELTRLQYYNSIAEKDFIKSEKTGDYWPAVRLRGLGSRRMQWQLAWDFAALDENIGHFRIIRRQIIRHLPTYHDPPNATERSPLFPESGTIARYLTATNFVEYEPLWLRFFLEFPDALSLESIRFELPKPYNPDAKPIYNPSKEGITIIDGEYIPIEPEDEDEADEEFNDNAV